MPETAATRAPPSSRSREPPDEAAARLLGTVAARGRGHHARLHACASILEIRRALEWIQLNVDWDNPGSKKLSSQCNQTERWWRIQDALYIQTCGALHNDAVTKSFDYDRGEAETLLALTAALLRNGSSTSAST
ncbi:hypothetical protein OG705_30290 [Streptomyces sp. NBC_00838]|uniref:hypothetical protein n=1 Tax=Streptomyces sp. NBC_00838 TaxID=2903680 RepID=UPI00386A6BF5|nr:hypothetical protein OG705_30290 [Streptomyces sp. NBC_00838]